MTSRYSTLERLLTVMRVRQLQLISLSYRADPGGTAHADLVAVELGRKGIQLIGAQLTRIVGVRRVTCRPDTP